MRRIPWPLMVILALLGVVAAAVGAYLDWQWWHPTSGIMITIAAGAVLLLAGVVALGRTPSTRMVSMAIGTVGIGLLLGQNLGPSREAPILGSGTITLQLIEPAGAAEVTGRADCNLTASGDSFAVWGDPNIRLEVGDQELRDRDFVGISITAGDMWEAGAEPRPDGIGLSLLVGGGGPIPEDGAPSEVMMASAASSELEGTIDQRSGSIRFSGLVVHPTYETGAGTEPMDLAGTVSWTCEELDTIER
jgi:hypothetical protein